MNAPHFENQPPIDSRRIVILYDDRQSGLRAKCFSDQLSVSLGGESLPGCWRNELLELPDLARAALREAVAAEFLILSLRGDEGLSGATKQWLENWLEIVKGGPASLIVLFDPERNVPQHAEGLRCYFRFVCAQAGVPFFAHAAMKSDRRTGGAMFGRSEVRANQRTSRKQPSRFWSAIPVAAALAA